METYIKHQLNNPNFHGSVSFINKVEEPPKMPLVSLPKIDFKEVIGRDDEIADLISLLKTTERVLLVSGLPGIGKTILARTILTKQFRKYKYILWIEVSKGVKEAFALNTQLIDSLHLNEIVEGFGVDKIFELIINRLSKLKGKNLLVIDNVSDDVEDLDLLSQISLKPFWSVLVTSREKLVGFEEYELGYLKPEKAIELFYTFYNQERNDEILNNILVEVDYHTLLIEVLSKTAQNRRLKLIELLDFVKKKALNFLEGAEKENFIQFARGKNKKIIKVLTYLLEILKISELSEYEKNVLTHFCVLPSVYIPFFDKDEKISIKDFLRRHELGQRVRLSKGINSLVTKGWLIWDKNNDALKMHQAIQAIVRDFFSPSEQKCKDIVEYFGEILNEKFKKREAIQSYYKVLPYIDSVYNNLNSEKTYSISLLTNNLSILYKGYGKYKTAISFLQKSLEIDEFLNNKESIADTCSNLAENYYYIGELNKAIEFQLR